VVLLASAAERQLGRMAQVAPVIGAIMTRSQLRRAQRKHTQQAYRLLQQRLLAVIRPSPPEGIIAVNLEEFRLNQYIPRPQGRPNSTCSWCGVWTPLFTDKSTAGEAVHNDPVEEVGEDCQPEVVSLSPEGNMLSDELIARVTLHDKVPTLKLLARRSQQLQEQLHLIRDLHEQAFLARPIEPASIDCVHARNARHGIEEYYGKKWNSSSVPLSVYSMAEVLSLQRSGISETCVRNILYARHIVGRSCSPERSSSSFSLALCSDDEAKNTEDADNGWHSDGDEVASFEAQRVASQHETFMPYELPALFQALPEQHAQASSASSECKQQ